jgi:thiaminase/transcriptional activator TenA
VAVTTISCESLRSHCLAAWEAFPEHPFLHELVSATLPHEKFRFYIEQNLLYLPEYGRCIAIAASKATDLRQMRAFAESLVHLVGTEIDQNRKLRDAVVELGAAPTPGGGDQMAPATVAYTSYLVATAYRYGPLETLVALMPCAWSYGDNARALEPHIVEHPVYADYVRFYTTDVYLDVVEEMKRDLDELLRTAPPEREDELARIFTMGVRLERAFWDMAYGRVHWPDVG